MDEDDTKGGNSAGAGAARPPETARCPRRQRARETKRRQGVGEKGIRFERFEKGAYSKPAGRQS
jgi:hypothetical protein